MQTGAFQERARAYIEKALPHAPAGEKQKLFDDWTGKEEAAEGILADFIGRTGNPAGSQVLDIGFGNGITLSVFARYGAAMSGLEVSPELFTIAKDYLAQRGTAADLRLYDGAVFPFASESFKYAYSVSVLEHTSNAVAVLGEAGRVLKPGGKFYLAFPNRWNPKETHTGVWFLSYLPRKTAGRILSLFGRNSLDDWNLHFLSFFWLRRTLKKNRIPLEIELEDGRGAGVKRVLKRVLAAFGIHHSALLPHIMVILTKKS